MLGGATAARLQSRGIKGAVVHGRVRNLGKLGALVRGGDAEDHPVQGGDGRIVMQDLEEDPATKEWREAQQAQVRFGGELQPPSLPPRPSSAERRSRERERMKEPFPVWSRGTSVVGSGAETKPWAINVLVRIGLVEVYPGDLIMLDPSERGALCIPSKKVDKVLDVLQSEMPLRGPS